MTRMLAMVDRNCGSLSSHILRPGLYDAWHEIAPTSRMIGGEQPARTCESP